MTKAGKRRRRGGGWDQRVDPSGDVAPDRVADHAPHRPAAATGRQWLAAVVAGLVLGYSARLAFGCNIGAFFSGISTGSLHGWVWFAAAFAGSLAGVKLRAALGLKA